MRKKIIIKKIVYLIITGIFLLTLMFSTTGCLKIISLAESKLKSLVEESRQEKDSEKSGNEKLEDDQKESNSGILQKEQEGDLSVLAQLDEAISTVAESVKPSVVNIQVIVQQEDMFGNIRQGSGIGSGIIYSPDGYIITNNHVVGSAQQLIVTLQDGKEYTAQLIGKDENTDIAVIKIDADNLHPANFTTIEDIKVGQIAIAVGSPFGLQETVTMGVISALGRDVYYSYESLPMVDLIQTDAAINPGNSGGALVNGSGQVIGVNTMIYSTSGTNTGIGFAIPSDTAVNIAEQLIKYGEAKMPFIGIEMGNNTSDIAGVLVKSVIKGTPAEEAGIKSGDIITEFEGVAIDSPFALIAQLLKHDVGDIVEIKIYRNNRYLEIDIELGEAPKEIN